MGNCSVGKKRSVNINGPPLNLQSAEVEKETHNFKILIVGDAGVGKTSAMMRYADDSFNATAVTTNTDFVKVDDIVRGQEVNLTIHDTAGQERFRTITSSFYRGADGIFIVFDLNRKDTFSNVPSWMKDIERYASDNVVVMLLGNKSDLESNIYTNIPTNWSRDKEMLYFETSAKDGTNIKEAFTTLCAHIIDNKGLDFLD